MNRPINTLLGNCCGYSARAAARSIRLSTHYGDARLVGADACDNWYPLHESLYDRIYRVSSSVDDPGYARQLLEICASENIDLAIFGNSKEVLFWTRESLGVPVSTLPPRFAEVASDKGKLFDALAATGLVPGFSIRTRAELLGSDARTAVRHEYPLWVRDFSIGTNSGKGALKVHDLDELRAWVVLNKDMEAFMLSAFLPGRNFACCMLFDDDRLLKHCGYERLGYLMANVAPSGITGNTSRGRLVNDERVLKNATAAVHEIGRQTGERITGVFTVDLREDDDGVPLLTEINVRHIAVAWAYAEGGCNMVEAQIHHGLGRLDLIDGSTPVFPEDNYVLRDIDGGPLWIQGIDIPEPGSEFLPRKPGSR